MSRQEIKQAMVSIIIGACTIFLVTVLEGFLGIIKAHLPEISGGAVAAWRYALSARV